MRKVEENASQTTFSASPRVEERDVTHVSGRICRDVTHVSGSGPDF